MITDPEWNHISKTAFPLKAAKAPPFLWTRLLSAIEAEESRRAQSWWMQWRWMSRLTVSVGLLVSLGAFYLTQHAAVPLDIALDGQSTQQQALEIARADMPTSDDSAVLVVGLDS